MKKRKILDPWRIAPEVTEEDAESAPLAPDHLAEEEESQCVQFKGRRGGLNVWLNYIPKEPASAAMDTLVTLIIDLGSSGYGATLHRHGVDCDHPYPERDLILLDRGTKAVNVCPPNGPETLQVRAVDAIAFALREIQNMPGPGREFIRKSGVKPYSS